LLAAPFGLFLGFCAGRWEVDAVLSGKVEGGLCARPEPLHGGPQVRHVAVPPAAVTEESGVWVNVEARMLVIVVGVRTAADECPPRGLKVSVTSGEFREVHLLA
jgi:hypothetical protein